MNHKGHNAYPKHGLAGQNDGGTLTPNQIKQRGRQLGRNGQIGGWKMPVNSSRLISFKPHSISSDPGTSKDVLRLKNKNGEQMYVRIRTGQILRIKQVAAETQNRK